jgi:dolichol-phosphate mannosyltransferase
MICIIIPTYNEAENIELLCKEIFEFLPDSNIIIVDDDSKDKTAEIAQALIQNNSRIRLISRKGKKRSFSHSYIEGFKEALAAKADYIIQMDADFSHNPQYLPLIIDELNNYDIVVGSRYVNGGKAENWSFLRRVISHSGNLYARIITGLPLADSTAGFAGWRAETLKKIDFDKISSDGYAFQIEMKFRGCQNNSKVKEIPIVFTERKFGSSKMRKRIILEAALACLKLRFF